MRTCWNGCTVARAAIIDLRFLSRSSQSWFRLIHAVEEIEPEEYSLSVWEDAYQYLTGESAAFTSVQEGKQRLLQRLK